MSAPRPSSTDEELVAILERAFAHHAGADAIIDLPELRTALGLRNEYLARRILRVFDADGDGVVRKEEFLAGVRALVVGTEREKLHFAFRLHDHNDDGALSREEILRMIAVTMAESDASERATQSFEQLTDALFKRADYNHDGGISFEELERVVARRPHLLARMTRSEAIWIAPNEDLLDWLDRRDAAAAPPMKSVRERGLGPWFVLGACLIANVSLFVLSMLRGTSHGEEAFTQIGRALGPCIALDGALILIPTMRGLLSRLRTTWLGRIAPIDDAIDFHRIVGHTLFALSLVHAAAIAGSYLRGHSPEALARYLALARVGLTGSLLIGVFGIMWVCSLSFIRRTSRFELFYFTHTLYVAWLGLAIAHAPSVLFWIGVPLVGLFIEQILRRTRRRPSSAVVSAKALRSGVTRLELARPPGFRFGAGDYVFLRIPSIARREWHPFTISSAPERDHLTFHVRALGNWTSALRLQVETKERAGNDGAQPIEAFVDGPYGSPSAHIFASRHAILIGGGIGVTPFASVLESIVMRANDATNTAPQPKHTHFFWLNRDPHSFEWFTALLRDLEQRDHHGTLEIHLCLTGARVGASSLGLELARDVMHDAGRSDVFTGLRTHTHVGPPDWNTMLGAIAHRHQPDRVDVFFCGPPGLAAKLRPICARLGMTFREERF